MRQLERLPDRHNIVGNGGAERGMFDVRLIWRCVNAYRLLSNQRGVGGKAALGEARWWGVERLRGGDGMGAGGRGGGGGTIGVGRSRWRGRESVVPT
jgi:hypothetical protein